MERARKAKQMIQESVAAAKQAELNYSELTVTKAKRESLRLHYANEICTVLRMPR
jgi:hypothetical protein